ncbi:uncharacterized protein EAF02_004434 [Botrytis sinoallii]|uniref:uncharacterized protein n=1 Tax=Botrytis sinoallii TaxID=1463999 RepID=UPI0019018545|nr:uncharacterized protein EAF02_004434 [Botrytis sinoallii]KAF7885925.1 hypothetical protein EAF02_004434 [Botrytis sinoallii]
MGEVFHDAAGNNSTDARRKKGLSESWTKNTRLYMLHGKEDVFVPLSRSEALAAALERYRARGQGFATLEWSVLDDLRHSFVERVWPCVRKIWSAF